MSLDLTDRQKKVIGTALTTVSVVIVAGVVITLLTYIIRFFAYFSSVFLPLAVAVILATLLKPYYNWLLSRLRHSGLSVTVLLLSLLVPVLLLLVYYGGKMVSQTTGLLNEIPTLIANAYAYVEGKIPEIREFLERYGLRERVQALLEGQKEAIGTPAKSLSQGLVQTGAFLFGTIGGALSWVVVPIYFVFLVQAPDIDWKRLDRHLPFFKEKTRNDVIYLVSEFFQILTAFFRGQLIVALCQGLLFAIGFALCGLPHGFILGLALGFLNIIPYLGNIVGLAVVIPLAWFHPEVGGPGTLLSVGAVFVAVQCIEGYILTPRIMGKQTGLHPMAIIFAIFFWGTALQGLMGMILAIPLTAFLVVFWRLLRKHYIEEVV